VKRPAACIALLLSIFGLSCALPAKPVTKPQSPLPPYQTDARPKRARAYTYFEQQGIAQLVTGATCNAVMIWPAEQHDKYLADLEREVEAYRRAPWCGRRHE
jgi:hypothetical protein